MNTFEDAFKIAIEKHMNKKNREIESGSLHPLNLIEMIENRKEDKIPSVKEFSMSAGEATGKMGNSTSGVSG
mgnify:CR=1 FL=1